MISAWWLLLIVPASALIGFVFCALLHDDPEPAIDPYMDDMG